MIVDEFTGRLMPGRRWSDGLHQAVEAKEGVKIKEENQTLATITLQNYFRMYEKLAGMTGTADTEAAEFKRSTASTSSSIPTNQPMIRIDNHDVIYKTEEAKFERGHRRDPGAPRDGPAGAGRHGLDRKVRAASPTSSRRPASSTRCSTPRTTSARPRSWPRPAASAASRSRPTWPAAAPISCSAATPSSWPRRERSRTTRAQRRDATRFAAAARASYRAECRRRTREQVRDAGGLLHPRHRAAREPAHRQPAARPLRPPGRPRQLAVLPLARGRPDAHLRRRDELG